MLDFINTYIFGPALCVAVFGCGTFLLFYLKFFFMVKPKRVINALRYGAEEGLSPAKAMSVALAGTLGVGNIAGVASAVAIGGAGAVFWMLVSSIAAMPLKYAEVVLAMKHRRRDKSGRPHGGAYFYISEGGSKRCRCTAALFAVLCIACSLTVGTAVQSNAVAVSAKRSFGLPSLLTGTFIAILVFCVISGGLERISTVTSRLIPSMSAVYILMSLFIIMTNLSMIPEIVREILIGAFEPKGVGGGVLGFLTSQALRIGVTRGIVSNEAGCGTAPIAHAGTGGKEPARQGVWGMVEVVVDTAIICTLTAFAVLIAEKHGVKPVTDGMAGAVAAYSRFIPFADTILTVSVFIFAFCTVICWFHYGTESLNYLTGRKSASRIYTLIYAITVFFGAVLSAERIWSICDLIISMMTAVNVTAIILLSRQVRRETDRYFFDKKQ